jgi:hypothetical protein
VNKCTQRGYSNLRNVVSVIVVSSPFTVSDPYDSCLSALLTEVLGRHEHLLRMLAFTLAPITKIRIERQCLVSVLVGTLWFRPVSSRSFESFFRYLTKGKCCLPCDSDVFCITVCPAA